MTKIKGIRALTESDKADIRVYRDQEYLVVPVVAIIEGVRFGANQTEAELGLIEDIAKYPYAWDNKPLVLGHPQKNKVFVSANSVDILGEYSFGFTNATYVDDKKLKMEAWINLAAVDYATEVQDVIDRINADETIEVSVGFACDVLPESGIYQGKKYAGIWKNIVPDHLAFLLDDIGACSIADGCGVPRINSKIEKEADLTMTLKTDTSTVCSCAIDTKNCSCQDNKTLEVSKVKNVVLSVDNSIVMEDLFSNLYTVLKENIDKALWLITATSGEDSTAVYEIYDENSGYYMMKGIRFNMDSEGNVELIGEPFPVRLMTKLIKMGGKTMSQANTQEEPKTQETTKGKEDKVETKSTEQQPQTTENVETQTQNDQIQAQAQKTTPVTQTKVLSRSDAISAMSAEDQAVVKEALRVHESKRTEAIKLLSASDKCKFSADYLERQSLDVLDNMIMLAGLDNAQTPDDYSGRSVQTEVTVQNKPEDGSLHGCVAAPKVFAVK